MNTFLRRGRSERQSGRQGKGLRGVVRSTRFARWGSGPFDPPDCWRLRGGLRLKDRDLAREHRRSQETGATSGSFWGAARSIACGARKEEVITRRLVIQREQSRGSKGHMPLCRRRPFPDVQEPMMTQSATLTGKCFCGAVHYAVADEFAYALNCHCSNCRRTTGAAFKPVAGIPRDKLLVTRGADQLLIYGEPMGNDQHCRQCGSLLYSVVRNGAFVHVAMGTLVDAPSIRPAVHIFVGSKAPWFTSPTICRNTRPYSGGAMISRVCGR